MSADFFFPLVAVILAVLFLIALISKGKNKTVHRTSSGILKFILLALAIGALWVYYNLTRN